MRRRLPSLLLVPTLLGALNACGGTEVPSGPPSPRDAHEVTSVSAGEEAGARSAVIGFLTGYAHSPRDGGERLGAAVAPAGWIRRWAHWVDVQNRQFPGALQGELVLRSIGPAEAPEPQPTGVRVIAVDAFVRFRLDPDDGAPFVLTRAFTSVQVTHLRSAGWVVTDAIRDGVPLSATFVAFGPPMPSARTDGIRITLDSFISFPSWQFHLFAVASASDATLRRAQLVAAGGRVVADAGTATDSIRALPAHEPAEGIVTFEPRASLEGLALRLVYTLDGRDHEVTLDLDAAVTRAGGALATA